MVNNVWKAEGERTGDGRWVCGETDGEMDEIACEVDVSVRA